MDFRPQLLAAIGLVALVPVVVFLVARGESIVAFAIVNTLLIVASLYYMLSPVGGGHDGHATH